MLTWDKDRERCDTGKKGSDGVQIPESYLGWEEVCGPLANLIDGTNIET